jgi:hypothetical protein
MRTRLPGFGSLVIHSTNAMRRFRYRAGGGAKDGAAFAGGAGKASLDGCAGCAKLVEGGGGSPNGWGAGVVCSTVLVFGRAKTVFFFLATGFSGGGTASSVTVTGFGASSGGGVLKS